MPEALESTPVRTLAVVAGRYFPSSNVAVVAAVVAVVILPSVRPGRSVRRLPETEADELDLAVDPVEFWLSAAAVELASSRSDESTEVTLRTTEQANRVRSAEASKEYD